jgi:hypothetical protein
MQPDSSYSWNPIQKFRRKRIRFGRTAATCLGVLTLGACRDVGPAFGNSIPAARANADALFGGIAERFTNVQRNPKFTVARGKLGKNALTPSVIFNDTSVWTMIGPDNIRTVTVEGGFANNRYLFAAKPNAAVPDAAGESRHLMVLKRLSDDEFEWFTNVDIAAGSITANDMKNVVSALMKSAEHRTPAAVRADYRESFPRTTAALGRLFSLDSLKLVRDADSATTITLGIRLEPERLRQIMPAFADYLAKYSTESRYRAVVTDKRGGRWIELSGEKNFMTLKLKTRDGHFAPLNGAPREIPRDLVLESDFTTKILLFRVGYSKMVSDVTLLDSEHERGWLVRFTHEPDWQLPPTIGFFIRTPLRRPFQGQGGIFRLALFDSPGKQSIIGRQTSATVQESTILRFLNRLSGTAMGDFVGKAEIEENRFSAEAFNAMRLDAKSLLE